LGGKEKDKKMKRSFSVLATVATALVLTACGLDATGSDGTDAVACTDCGTTPVDECSAYGKLPSPIRSVAPWQITVHLRYLPADTNTVSVVGTLPGMNWQVGIPAPCQDAECTLEIPHDEFFVAGEYEITYVRGLPGDPIGGDDWASYGKDATMLACMPEKAQDWIGCDLEYGRNGSVRIVACGLTIHVSASGEILPAGNMAGFGG
jgi:hypothetical protein